MDEVAYDELRKTVRLVANATKPYRFMYMPAAEDGAPLLLIKKKLPNSEVLQMRATGKKKLYAAGFVVAAEDKKSLKFHPEEEPPTKFGKHLKSVFGKEVVQLKKSTVAPAGSLPTGTGGKDLETARSEHESAMRDTLKKSIRKTRKLDEFEEKQLRSVDAGKRWDEAYQEKDRLSREIRAKQKKVDDLLKDGKKFKLFRTDKKKKAILKEGTDGSQELIRMRQEMAAAMEGMDLADEQIVETFKAFRELEEAIEALEAAEAQEKKAAAVLAEAEAIKAESDLEVAEDQVDDRVEELAKTDKDLKKALDEAYRLDGLAAAALLKANRAANDVAALEEKLDDFEDGEEKTELLIKLEIARIELDQALKEADEAARLAGEGQKGREEALAIAASADETLRKALEGLKTAKSTVTDKDDAEVKAQQKAIEAADRAALNKQNRRPKCVIEGLDERTWSMALKMLPPGDPGIVVDTERKRIGVAYDALVFGQRFKSLIGLLNGAEPMKSTPGEKKSQKFAACFGRDSYKQEIEETKKKLSDRGRKMVDEFDWDESDDKLTKDYLDGLDSKLDKDKPGRSVRALLTEGDNEGIMFGEQHRGSKAQPFLFDNLEHFITEGVDTLYVEHLLIENQPILDAWFLSPDEKLPESIKKSLEAVEVDPNMYPRNLVGLVEKCKKKGVRVVGIDSQLAKGDMDPTCDEHKDERVRRMNALASDVMKGDKGRKGKFIALTGAAHNMPHVGDPKPVPGVGNLMGVPSIEIDDSDVLKTQREDSSIRGL